MAAVLDSCSSSMDDIKKFITESKKIKINVLGPSINESNVDFSVNDNGDIRFGLGSIRGLGEIAIENVVKEIIKAREIWGGSAFKNIYDFLEIVDVQISKAVFEVLCKSGAFDDIL